MEDKIPHFSLIEEFIEELSSCEHERWSHWQRYMHSKGKKDRDGNLVIPASLVVRWERLMNTKYSCLSEEEKESDREQVRRYVPILGAILERATD
jgi:hypothetical protein